MATFKALILKHDKKKDGTFNVKVRVIHNKVIRYLGTPYFIAINEITKAGRIKNQMVFNAMEDQVRKYRDAYNTLGEASEKMTVDQIVEFITKKEEQFQLDFIRYGREVIGEMDAAGRGGTAENYRATLNTICKFTGRPSLDVAQITSSFLKDFLKWLDTRPGKRRERKALVPDLFTPASSGRFTIRLKRSIMTRIGALSIFLFLHLRSSKSPRIFRLHNGRYLSMLSGLYLTCLTWVVLVLIWPRISLCYLLDSLE
jgi:hypothetical protein